MQVEHRNEEQQREHHYGESRRITVAVIGEGRLVERRHQDIGLLGAARLPGDQVDHVDIVEGPHGAQRNGGQHHRLHQRHGYVAQLLEISGAVYVRRVVIGAGDALQAAQDDHHHERDAQPDVDDGAGEQRVVGEPLHRGDAQVREEGEKPEELGDHNVDEAVLRVELAAHREHRDHLGHGPRYHQQRAVDALEADIVVQQQRQRETAGDVEENVGEGPHERPAQQRPESDLGKRGSGEDADILA